MVTRQLAISCERSSPIRNSPKAATDLAGLDDEYCVDGNYTAGEPGSVDLTINTNRATLKWGKFVDPGTPVPTGSGTCAGYNQGTKPAGWDDNQDVGLFEGGSTMNTGIFRPVINCRMRSNSPPYCPVCYTSFSALSTFSNTASPRWREDDLGGARQRAHK